ncbi:hypothetical protein XELAEV_18026431mg [Xenopus laevis]|uniref:2'-deoxynucleoside 5'-phosphate N-hydrolase 1 n=1 Tax=Xenopus laevis TaxID=8355 RepID=A0A974HJ02_XENLA|nr:hypothetical protein XELAEV_18026431mg [Xenopus laevis]
MAALRVYFCGSIRGGREDQALYERIVRELRRYGTVLTEHVARPEIGVRGEDAEALGDKFIHDRDMDWLNQADVVVAEVTQPSLGVGYEIGRAVDMNKRILCLFRPSSGRGQYDDLFAHPLWGFPVCREHLTTCTNFFCCPCLSLCDDPRGPQWEECAGDKL